mmetsp:Transcript_24494/g.50952  ORF Transcript_24494/g.50952 Transcript_24494/m.50952 type:complete len:301 (-) Transcript_24494:938-1840(-)
MTFGCEGTVSNLGSLESNNHVGSRTKHGQVSSNGGRVRNLQPFVRRSKGESSSKHLHNGHVGGNVGQQGHNHDEPVHTCTFSHLISTSTHGEVEESLGNTGIIERTNEEELTNEKHEKTVINFSKSGFGFSNKFFFFRFNFISIHVVGLLGWKRVAIFIVLDVFGLGIVVLTLVCGNAHENAPSSDRDDAHIISKSKEDKETEGDNKLDLGPDRPSVLDNFFSILVGSLAGVVSMFLGEHFRGAVSGEHDSKVFREARRSREQFGSVVDEHHTGIDQGGGKNGQEHVLDEFNPADIIISQ